MTLRQVRFAGLGGQGIVMAGTLLGEAATLAGLNAAGSNSYGAAARGTACRSDVVLDDVEIDYPHLARADVLVVMSQAAYELFRGGVVDGGLVLYDDFFVKPTRVAGAEHRAIPATATAIREFGGRQSANVVMLGALVGCTGAVPADPVREAIRHTVRERFVAPNLRAFDLGIALAKAKPDGGGRR